MNEEIKHYADTLFRGSLEHSAFLVRESVQNFKAQRALRALPTALLSGPDIKALVEIHSRFIGEIMSAKVENYMAAFEEAGTIPSEEDLSQIWVECEELRTVQVKHSVRNIREFIGSNGGGSAYLPTDSEIETRTAPRRDSAFNRWSGWKAKVRLKRATGVPAPQGRERKLDAKLPLYDSSEFDRDLKEVVPKGTVSTPVSLLMIDLDHFKNLNDGKGHLAGDKALKALADAILQTCAGKGHAYRFGGDEFCILLNNHSLDEAMAVAERVRLAAIAVRTDEVADGLSLSIGVACFPETITDPAKLAEQADQAMYVSKNGGKNRVSRAVRLSRT